LQIILSNRYFFRNAAAQATLSIVRHGFEQTGNLIMALISRRVQPDRSRIELTDEAAIRHWAKTLGATKEEITIAVKKVGGNMETVRKELSRCALDKNSNSASASKRNGG